MRECEKVIGRGGADSDTGVTVSPVGPGGNPPTQPPNESPAPVDAYVVLVLVIVLVLGSRGLSLRGRGPPLAGLSTRTSPGKRHAVGLVLVIVLVLGSRGIAFEDEYRPWRG